MNELHEKAVRRKRMIIMNNDGNDCHKGNFDEKVMSREEAFLSRRTSPLAGSQVSTIFYCSVEADSFTHWNVGRKENIKPWPSKFFDKSMDRLSVMTDFCHNHDMEIFWSMRMNDTHDSCLKWETKYSAWKNENPECLMGTIDDNFPFGSNRWSALNYSMPKVRDKVFNIFKDICTGYDIDGIELDFFRHPVFFKPQLTGNPVMQEECDIMTGLITRIRKMTQETAAKRKKPMLIAVRIPDSIKYSKALGLDVKKWLDNDLVDIITGGGYFHLEPWENLVFLGKEYNKPVYACLSGSRLGDSINPEAMSGTDIWRSEALAAWKAGVDGIYTFNLFNPESILFKELGDPKTINIANGGYKPITVPENSWSKPEKWLKNGDKFLINK